MQKNLLIIFHDLGIGGVQRKIADSVTEISKDNKTKINIILEIEKNYDLHEDLFLKEIKNSVKDVYYYRSRKDIDFAFFRIPITFYIIWKILLLKPTNILVFMEPYAIPAIMGKIISEKLFKRKVRTVVGFDNIPTKLLELEFPNNWRFYYWKYLIKLFFPLADSILVPSDESKKDMAENFGVAPAKIAVNKNWVRTPVIKKAKRKKYDVLYSGRVDRVKNLRLFLDVISELKKKLPRIKACIVGWGDEMQDILEYAKEQRLLDNVEFAGTQADMGTYYSASKVFLLTSDFEGLPIVGLEAMSYGLPVISRNYPGVEELVENGKTGFVGRDKKDLSEIIYRLLKDPLKLRQLGLRGRAKVIKAHGRKSLKDFTSEVLSGKSDIKGK